jgi:hypothetical protein
LKTRKRILIIAPYAFGYTSHIHDALKNSDVVESMIVYLDKPSFEYRNIFHKVQNFFSKLFIGKNLKKTFVFDRIKSEVSMLQHQDIIFIIRPDILDDSTLKYLKSRADNFIAYYYDSTRRFPRKVDIIPFFDTIYSYDKLDVETYGLKFITNYIFNEHKSTNTSYQFFNISTVDYRLPFIEKLADYIKERGWTYNIQIYNGTPIVSDSVQIITTQKSIEEVGELIKDCEIIIEIQREEQIGLSFRIFEALGYHKKLITTNADVVNYDFYHPQNILVLNPENPEIPEAFVTSEYITVPENILDKYRLKNWVKQVFEL